MSPRRVSLPTYPFLRQRYWVPEHTGLPALRGGLATAAVLHPLVQRNVSTLEGVCFTSTFTGREIFLRDHVIRGERVLPGTAYLEMAREAVRLALDAVGAASINLRDVVWLRPFIVGAEARKLSIRLLPAENAIVRFEIVSEADGASLVHAEGVAEVAPVAAPPVRNLEELRGETGGRTISAEECYAAFMALGVYLRPDSPRHRNIARGIGGVLAKLAQPTGAEPADDYVVHPGLLDSAIQAAIGLGAARAPGDCWPTERTSRCHSPWSAWRSSRRRRLPRGLGCARVQPEKSILMCSMIAARFACG